jgi:spore germination protein GerM
MQTAGHADRPLQRSTNEWWQQMKRMVVILATAALACAERAPGGDRDAPDDTAAGGASRSDSAPQTPASLVTIHFTHGDTSISVTRRVHADSAGLEGALRQLLRGPTASERDAGIQSWFSDATTGMLRSVTVDSAGRAVVDFADLREIIPNASTSAGSTMLLRELNATVFEHGPVRSVEYRIEGSCDIFGEWLQYGCLTMSRP